MPNSRSRSAVSSIKSPPVLPRAVCLAHGTLWRGLAGLARSGRGGGGLLLLVLDDLALEKERDVIADDPLAVEHRAERHAEVLAIDLALGAVADTVAHHRVVEFAIDYPRQRDRLGIALDGQVAGQVVAIATERLDLGALEGDRRVVRDVEEVGGSQVVVALLVVGPDARRLDGNFYCRRFWVVGVDIPRDADLGEVATHRHHAQVLGGELDLRVERIGLPGHTRAPFRFRNDCLWKTTSIDGPPVGPALNERSPALRLRLAALA